MAPNRSPLRVIGAAWMILGLAAGSAPAAAQGARAKPRPPARSGAPSPKTAPAGRPPTLTAANLGGLLKSLGYAATPVGQYQRITVEEPGYRYPIDLSLSKSGDWLVCMAHLAPVEDLTQLRPAPLMSLLSTNDHLLGMYFSYDRVNARIMLNAAVPNRYLDAASVRNILEGLKLTIRETRGLWDTSKWESGS